MGNAEQVLLLNTEAKMSITNKIKERIKAAGGSFFANDNISEFLMDGDLARIQPELEQKFKEILDILVIDHENDHNTNETPKRLAKMYLQELFAGRYQPIPSVTEFPNVKNLDEIICVGPLSVKSVCSHHLATITGHCWIGILPSNRLLGLSKYSRLARWICRRPQIQEEMTIQLADLLEKYLEPRGIAIIIKSKHECMSMRGVEENDSVMTTSVMRGFFMDNSDARAEFFRLIK